MIPTGQGQYTQSPCPYHFPQIASARNASLGLGLAIISLALPLLLLLRRMTRQYQPTTQPHQHLTSRPTQKSTDYMDTMEKGTTSPGKTSIIPPPASACDVLQPLSQNGAFPSSGTVAAHAREMMKRMMQTAKASPSSPGANPLATEEPEGSILMSGSVQKRSESVQQMSEGDGEGLRTWRRVVTEYS